MALGNTAENLEEPNPLENADNQNQGLNSVDANKLSAAEVKALERGETNMDKIVSERNRLAQDAEDQLDSYTKPDAKGQQLVDLDEYKALKEEIENTDSPDKMEEILKRLKELPKEKEKQKAKEKDESKELSLEHPKIQQQIKKFNAICDLNKALIGEGELKGFKEWFRKEMKKNPTVKNAKETIEKLEGTNSKDKGGLYPRREAYQTLQKLFKDAKLSSPLQNDYIKREGLSERKLFIEKAKEAKDLLESTNDRFWSPKARREAMKEILEADSPAKQDKMIQDIKEMKQIEGEGFSYMTRTEAVNGHTIRMMSDASIALYLEGIVNKGNLTERKNHLTGNGKAKNGIIESVKNEFSLANKKITTSAAKIAGTKEGLAAIYKDDKEGFAEALKTFQKLDFMGKVEALKDHKKLVEKAKTAEEREIIKTKMKAKAKINESASKKDVSRKTQEKWIKWWESENALKDPESGKETGLDALKEHYKILTDENPTAKHKNLSAFKIKRDRFVNELKKYAIDNPDIDPVDIQKWQDRYDKEGWTERKQVYKDFDKERKLTEKDRKKQEAIEKDLDKKNKNKEELETSPEIKKTIEASQELMNDNQNEEAYALLAEHWLQHRPNLSESEKKELEFWMGVAKDKMEKFGRGEAMNDDIEQEIEQEVERLADNDTTIREDIDEQGLYHQNLEGAELSELRHNKNKDAQERAKKDAIAKAQGNKMKEDLTKDFFEQTDDSHILNREGTGEEIQEIKFDDTRINKEDRSALRDATRKHESDLTQKRGLTNVIFKNKSGQQQNTEQAKVQHEEDLEEIADTLVAKSVDKVAKKQGQEKPSNVFDINARITARRAAERKLKEEMEDKKRLREAA